MWPLCLVFLLINPRFVHNQIFWYQPEQVHLAYGDTVDEIVVTWSTFNDTTESVVEYGIGGFILTAKGSSKLFVDGGDAKHSQYIHTVRLGNLTYNSRYGNYIRRLYVGFYCIWLQCTIVAAAKVGRTNSGSRLPLRRTGSPI